MFEFRPQLGRESRRGVEGREGTVLEGSTGISPLVWGSDVRDPLTGVKKGGRGCDNSRVPRGSYG